MPYFYAVLTTLFTLFFVGSYKGGRGKLNARGEILSHEDFIIGWLQPDGGVTGRPVDLEQSPDGDLYLSDDTLGVVYRITGNKVGG